MTLSTYVLMFNYCNKCNLCDQIYNQQLINIQLLTSPNTTTQTFLLLCQTRAAGCGGLACAAVAVCVPENASRGDPPSCPQQEQWCPFQLRCLPLGAPCPPASCPNCTQGHRLPQGAVMPQYALQDEVVFTLPAGPAVHVVVRGSHWFLCDFDLA